MTSTSLTRRNNKLTDKTETGLDAMAGDGGYQEAYLGDHIRFKMKREGKRFWAGDNISDYIARRR
jgi:hypothetical protein